MAKKITDLNIKLGKNTLLQEAIEGIMPDTFEGKITTKTITSNTDGSGFVYVGAYPNRTVNVFGFIQSFDGKVNLDLRYFHLIPVRNGNTIYFKVESISGTSVSSKAISFVVTIFEL